MPVSVGTDEEAEEEDPASSGAISMASGASGRRKHLYSEEIRCHWNFKKILKKFSSEQACIEFCEQKGLILRTKNCPRHRSPMPVITKGLVGAFRCGKGSCRRTTESRAKNTWFENARLPLTTIFQIMYMFCNSFTYEQVRKEVSSEESDVILSPSTVADWYSYCRETVVVYELEHEVVKGKIGGDNKIVQIDESKFGHRKYNRGRLVEGHWVIGMIEDGSDDLRLEVCPDNDRSTETLVPLIEKHVEKGSIIHTDFWRAYNSLPDFGYIHKRVNHSDPENRFVAPDGTHTQRIESHWRSLKTQFRKDNFKGDFAEWLIEYTWRRRIQMDHKDPFQELLKAIKYVYKIH